MVHFHWNYQHNKYCRRCQSRRCIRDLKIFLSHKIWECENFFASPRFPDFTQKSKYCQNRPIYSYICPFMPRNTSFSNFVFDVTRYVILIKIKQIYAYYCDLSEEVEGRRRCEAAANFFRDLKIFLSQKIWECRKLFAAGRSPTNCSWEESNKSSDMPNTRKKKHLLHIFVDFLQFRLIFIVFQ